MTPLSITSSTFIQHTPKLIYPSAYDIIWIFDYYISLTFLSFSKFLVSNFSNEMNDTTLFVITSYLHVHKYRYSVFQSLCGVMVDIPTLTGEKIPLNLANEVIRPNTVKRIPGDINCSD